MRRKLVATILLCSLCLLLVTANAAAKGFISSALKGLGGAALGFVGEQAIAMLAGAIYSNTCKVDSPEHNALDALCDTLGSASGVSDDDWRDAVSADLAAIKEDLGFLKAGQKAIQQQIDQVAAQNSLLLAKMDELADETVIRPRISLIRTLWDDEFIRLFNEPSAETKRKMYQDQLVNFARRIVTQNDMALVLGDLHDVLVRPGTGGKKPLLRLYAERLNAQMNQSGAVSVEPAYEYFQSVMTELLFIERQAYLMYLWGTEVLESECELDQDCKTPNLPHTSTQYVEIFKRHVEEQLDQFNTAVEWLIMARSEPHSTRANFLPPEAEQLFQRADFYTVANLGQEALNGIRGRVITMGPYFDGRLLLYGTEILRTGPITEVSLDTAEPLDWWRFGLQSNTVKQVHFSSQWRIFRYHIKRSQPGSFKFRGDRTFMAYATPIDVRSWDLYTGQPKDSLPADRSVLFASFTGVERVGGGYAMLKGYWTPFPPSTSATISCSAVNHKDERRLSHYGGWDDSQPGSLRIGLESRIEMEYIAGTGKSYGECSDNNSATMRSEQSFSYPDGGELTLNIEFEPGFLTCPGCDYSGFAEEASLMAIKSDYQQGGLHPQDAKIDAELAFVLRHSKGLQGLVLKKELSFAKPGSDDEKGTTKSVSVDLDKDAEYNPEFSASYSVKQRTIGWDASSWHILVQANLKNAYLTKPR